MSNAIEQEDAPYTGQAITLEQANKMPTDVSYEIVVPSINLDPIYSQESIESVFRVSVITMNMELQFVIGYFVGLYCT